MCKKRMKEVLSIYRAYFRRNFMRKKPVERAELSCRTWFSQTDGILSPQEWIDIARGAGVRAIAITDFQGVEGFKEAAQAVEKLRREAGPGELAFKMLYGLETVLEDGCPVHLLVRRQEGLAQLYRLLEISWQDREERPFLRKAEIGRHLWKNHCPRQSREMLTFPQTKIFCTVLCQYAPCALTFCKTAPCRSPSGCSI